MVTRAVPTAELDRPLAHAREIEDSEVGEQHEHRDEESEVADAIDDERFLPGVGVGLVVEPEPDQQVGAESDAFPADEQHGIVRAKHQHQHEEDEQIQIREEARVSGIFAHVADAEDVDQRSDTGDDEHHHHRQLIELERSIDLQVAGRHPAEVRLDERRFRGARRPSPAISRARAGK